MANYNYKEWVERLSGQMMNDLQSQIIKACNDFQTNDGSWMQFKNRVMGEFTDKYKIVEVTANGDLSELELTALMTYNHPINKVSCVKGWNISRFLCPCGVVLAFLYLRISLSAPGQQTAQKRQKV